MWKQTKQNNEKKKNRRKEKKSISVVYIITEQYHFLHVVLANVMQCINNDRTVLYLGEINHLREHSIFQWPKYRFSVFYIF